MDKRKYEAEFSKFEPSEEPLEKIVTVQDEGREPASVTVTVVNWDLGELALVRAESGEHRMLPKEFLAHSYGAQLMPFQTFITGIKPYDWADEINTLALTPDEMRDILYAQGYVVKQSISLAELTKNTLVRGKIPVMRRT